MTAFPSNALLTSVVDCDFNNSTTTCPRCGYVAGGPRWRKNCEGQPLLGTRLAHLLGRVGLTPDRWTRWTSNYRMVGGVATCRLVRVPPDEQTCGCQRRELWLNQVHAWLRARLFG